MGRQGCAYSRRGPQASRHSSANMTSAASISYLDWYSRSEEAWEDAHEFGSSSRHDEESSSQGVRATYAQHL